MLKAVKHLSMNATLLDVLQNANALEILIRILDEQSSGPHGTVCSTVMILVLYTDDPPDANHFRKCLTTSSKHATIYVD